MQQRTITIKVVQCLTGTLNFLCKAIIPGRTFTRMMCAKLKITDKKGNHLKQYHHVSVDPSFREDCQIWRGFLLDSKATYLCRPFVDLDKQIYAIKLKFYTDASLNKQYGIGGVFGNRFFYGKWPTDFIRNEKPSIEFAELLALTAGVLTWGHLKELRNTRVIIFCDNETVKIR